MHWVEGDGDCYLNPVRWLALSKRRSSKACICVHAEAMKVAKALIAITQTKHKIRQKNAKKDMMCIHVIDETDSAS